jgi:hypothetical protein
VANKWLEKRTYCTCGINKKIQYWKREGCSEEKKEKIKEQKGGYTKKWTNCAPIESRHLGHHCLSHHLYDHRRQHHQSHHHPTFARHPLHHCGKEPCHLILTVSSVENAAKRVSIYVGIITAS